MLRNTERVNTTSDLSTSSKGQTLPIDRFNSIVTKILMAILVN